MAARALFVTDSILAEVRRNNSIYSVSRIESYRQFDLILILKFFVSMKLSIALFFITYIYLFTFQQTIH